VSRSPRDVQRVKTQGQGKGAILFGPWPAGQLFYQVDSQCRYEAETGLPDEAITGLNAVRAPEGDFRLARDRAFRPAGSFRSSQGTSKCAVAPEEAMFCFGGGLRGIPCPYDQFCYVSTHAVFLRNGIWILEFYKLLYQKDLSNDQEVACKVLFSF